MTDNSILLQAVEQYGSPLFVYHGERIESQINTLRRAFDVPKLKLNYACKALTNPSILHLMKKNGMGIDAVSQGEVFLALNVGFEPHQIVYTPSGVPDAELDWVLKHGVRVNVDNMESLEFIKQHYPDYPVGIRVNPDIMAGGHSNISVGHKDSKFGIPQNNLHEVIELQEKGLKVEGLHLHTGSDILDHRVFLEALHFILASVEHFPNAKYIDMGSGFKVAYKPGDLFTDIESLGNEVSKVFNEFCEISGRDLTLEFEPGKVLVSESGTFLVDVNSVKHTVHKSFVCLNSGFNHLQRPMFYDAYHQIDNISATQDREKAVYDLVGYLCETDTFASDREMPQTQKGDILAIRNAGAYCFSMSSQYNSRLRPAEVLFYKGELHLIRQAETLEDITRHTIDVFQEKSIV